MLLFVTLKFQTIPWTIRGMLIQNMSKIVNFWNIIKMFKGKNKKMTSLKKL